MFRPVFGNEVSDNNGAQLQGPNVYPIFWGTWWLYHVDYSAQISDAFSKIAQSQYLSGITQYGTDGLAQVMPGYTDFSNDDNLPATMSPGYNNPASLEIEHVLYDLSGTLPLPDDPQNPNRPIYVVLTPPSVPGDGVNGFNQPGIHKVVDLDLREEIWVTSASLDSATQAFSHELVEAMTDPFGPVFGETVKAGGSFPAQSGAGSAGIQIADNEPNNSYVDRVDGPTGPLVQAYWSDWDNQYILPDGNSLVMQINPNPWTGSPPRFAGGTLVINAKQSGIPAGFVGKQSIELDTVTMPTGQQGMEVSMDGQSFDFEPGQLTDIEINAANDSETIAVNGTLTGVPVNIHLGKGKYVIGVGGPEFGGGQIQGPVTINTVAGGTQDVQLSPGFGNVSAIAATVTVKGNGAGTKISYTGAAVSSLTATLAGANGGSLQLPNATVVYSSVKTLNLSPESIGQLVLQGPFLAFGAEQHTITTAGTGTMVFTPNGGTINYAHVGELDDLVSSLAATYSYPGSESVVDGPTVHGLHTTSLTASANLVNFAEKLQVTVAATAPNTTIAVNNPHPADALAALGVDGGKGNANVAVQSTAVPTSVHNGGIVTLHAAIAGLLNIQGAVDVSSSKSLVIDDTGDNTAHSAVYLNGTSLNGLAPVKVSWDTKVSSITVTGGDGGNSYDVQSLAKGQQFTINTGNGSNLVYIEVSAPSHFSVTVNGGTGADELDVYSKLTNTSFSPAAPPVPAGQVGATAAQVTDIVVYTAIDRLSVTKASPGSQGPNKKAHQINLADYWGYFGDSSVQASRAAHSSTLHRRPPHLLRRAASTIGHHR
jgi:hypothetical protein